MSLYGDRFINNDALKRWVRNLSLDNITSIDIGERIMDITPETKTILQAMLDTFSNQIEGLKPDDDWRELQYGLSPLFYKAFFQHKENAIRIANFYECLIMPSNIKTYKKIIKGFDYISVGSIKICDGEKAIAEIGQKSDLIWSVFHDHFIKIGEIGNIEHTHSNHEEYMSIQFFDVENYSDEELNRIVQELLLRVSMEHGLDFHVVKLDSAYTLEGEDKIYESQFHSVEYEHIPTLYLNNALHSLDPRLAYLSYYQVLEYFFIRAQNLRFLNDYNDFLTSEFNHNELRKILKSYKNSTKELESLKLVLKTIDVSKLKNWISDDQNRINNYCNSAEFSIDLSKEDDKIISKLAERIYRIRCSIAHAKGDVEEYMAIPMVSENEIIKELDIMKFLSYEVLVLCSKM